MLSPQTTYKPLYRSIEHFAQCHGFTFSIFNRNNTATCFANVFDKEYSNLTTQYEEFSNFYEPFYRDSTPVTIDQKEVNEDLDSKQITFVVQSYHKNELKYVSHTMVDEYDKIPNICDVVFGPNIDLIEQFYDYLKMKCQPESTTNYLYLWNPQYGQYYHDGKKSYNKSINDLFGLKPYYKQVITDIKRYKTHKDMLMKLGESNGLNYMLYGPPGTGKSSFIRAMSSQLGLSLYVAKLTMAQNENQITNMLIPNLTQTDDFKIVLIEDFDRYLELDGSKTTMSAVLNALDGVFPAYNVIRFFSANDPNIISSNGALLSRMNRVMYFDLPNNEQIKNLIMNAFPNKINQNLIDEAVKQIGELKLSMRQITHYVCRYLDSADPVNDLLVNKDKWIEDMNKFNEYKSSVDDKQKDNKKPKK